MSFSFRLGLKMGKKLVEHGILIVLLNDSLKLGDDKHFLVTGEALIGDSGLFERKFRECDFQLFFLIFHRLSFFHYLFMNFQFSVFLLKNLEQSNLILKFVI